MGKHGSREARGERSGVGVSTGLGIGELGIRTVQGFIGEVEGYETEIWY